MMNVEEVKVLLEQKYTYSRIGEMYGKSRNYVASFVRRKVHGLPSGYVGTREAFRAGVPSKPKKKREDGDRRREPKQKPSMPYVPGVTEDGKRVSVD